MVLTNLQQVRCSFQVGEPIASHCVLAHHFMFCQVFTSSHFAACVLPPARPYLGGGLAATAALHTAVKVVVLASFDVPAEAAYPPPQNPPAPRRLCSLAAVGKMPHPLR